MGKKKKKNKQLQTPADPRLSFVYATVDQQLQESQMFSREIAAAVKEHLVGMWDPDCPKPRVEKVRLMACHTGKHLRVSVNVAVSVVYQVADIESKTTYQTTLHAPLNWDNGESEVVIAQRLRGILPPLMQRAIGEIRKKLPKAAEDILKRYLSNKYPALNAMLEELVNQPEVQEVLKERKAALEAGLQRRAAKVRCPAGFRLANITALRLHCCATFMSVEGTLRIEMENGVCREKQVEFELGNSPFYGLEERQRAFLQERFSDTVLPFVEQVGRLPLLYIAPSPREIPGMTEPLETLLFQGSVSLGQVTVQWDRPGLDRGPLLYQPQEDDGKVRIGRDGAIVGRCTAVPLYLDHLGRPAIPLERYAEQPRELAGLCRLGEALQTAVRTAFQGKEVPVPKMVLAAGKKFRLSLTCGSRSVTLDENEKETGRKLQQFVMRTAEIEAAKPLEKQRQLDVLNSLNPTELTALRYITDNGETWYTALASAIEDQVCTTKVYTGACLKRLTELEVPVNTKMKPLLLFRWASSRKHDDFRMYRAGAQLDREILASAAGRPFRVTETADMKTAERGKWCTRYLLEAADEQQRWARFNEILDHMPRTFLTEFVKSEAGQDFLRKFTGAEAMFVRLTVEELPGCKRLAAKLWPEEAESEDETV